MSRRIAAEKAAGAPAPKPSLKDRFRAIVTTTLTGNAHEEEAARRLLQMQATHLSRGGTRTVIVVVGAEADRENVTESLGAVERPITLMFVDTAIDTAASDNAALGRGLVDQVTGGAQNVWLYLPRSGAAAGREPDQKLSSKFLPSATWSVLFGVEGDMPPELSRVADSAGRTRSASPTSPSAPMGSTAPPSAPASSEPAQAGRQLADGDVVQPKIAGVKLLSGPSDTAPVRSTLSKAEELVVTGAERNGYVLVTGAAGEGWVRIALLAKR